MKVRNMKISIKSREDVIGEVKNVLKRSSQGKNVKKHEGIYFESLAAMRKVLTDQRLRILKTIKQKHPDSIYELAKILKRDIKNTYNDVRFLSDMGLIELKTAAAGREKTTPVVSYEKITLEIPVGAFS
jgi:predicted transcriptional regulator